MSVVVTFESYQPAPRYDAVPWTARIYEGTAFMGPWTLIDTIALSPTDADPANPAVRNFTTNNGTSTELWYQVQFADAAGDTVAPTTPSRTSPKRSRTRPRKS